MKHSLYLLGIVGLVSTFWACTAEDAAPPIPVNRGISEVSSSSPAIEQPTSSNIEQKTNDNQQAEEPKDNGKKSGEDNNTPAKKDTVNMDSTVVIKTVNDGSEFEDPYFSSGIFCWTEGCEEWVTSSSKLSSSSKAKSSSSAPKSSNSTPKSSSSKAKSSSSVYDGTTIADPRDENVKYRVRSIAGNTWMDDNVNYDVLGSKCYKDDESYCEKYGRLYNAEGAENACPEGWRLPNREDFEKAMSTPNFIWLYTGRIKKEPDNKSYNHDFLDEMGFLWVDGETKSSDKNYDKYPNGVLINVQKSPDYDASAKEREFFQVDEKDKYFSVRCVVGKKAKAESSDSGDSEDNNEED